MDYVQDLTKIYTKSEPTESLIFNLNPKLLPLASKDKFNKQSTPYAKCKKNLKQKPHQSRYRH